MKPELEADLRRRIVEGRPAGRTPRDAINDMLAEGLIKSPKQAWRTLEKWRDYEYGVSLDLGWLVPPKQTSPSELNDALHALHAERISDIVRKKT
jgi:hypothetical protein